MTEYIAAGEAARILGVSHQTLGTLVAYGQMRRVSVRSRYRYLRSEVELLAETRRLREKLIARIKRANLKTLKKIEEALCGT